MNPESQSPTIEAETEQRRAVEELREQTEAIREDLHKLGHAAKRAVQEKLGDARKAASDYYDQKKDKAGDLESQLVHYVQEKPVKSLLIATGVGMILGMMWSKR